MNHKLRVGEIREAYLTDEDIWRIFTQFLSPKSKKSATYKFVFMKALIENLYQTNDHDELSYDQMAYTFAKIYWNLVVNHKITKHNNGKNARVVTDISKLQQKHGIPDDLPFDKLNDTVQLDITNAVKATMKVNVFGALYGDTKGYFYAFDHKKDVLRYNHPVKLFMLKYQKLITYLTNYHMARMIEALNEDLTIKDLLTKVECIAKRSSLKPFATIIGHYFNQECFYCHKPLDSGKRKTAVDHFIPWSFVQSDNLWNLVLSCGTCNSSKSDKIPEETYLNNVLERNDQLIQQANMNEVERHMHNYKQEKMVLLYEYSIKNGYDTIWQPK
ncbi:HNH endonuclease [[Bacillus] selenitireducens MLS10]|uniref:HNH endonuclease n=2 Tax=Salisediminibacterium selenitireducens TaxID=85683 RepID=D6XXW4_BACIE|nr:HNH endonuclease [[Bacillus] selenitireducens MLS10]